MLKKTLTEEQIKLLNNFIENIEENFPSNNIYLDVSKGEVKKTDNKETETLLLEVKANIDCARNSGLDCESIIKAFIKTEPYCNDKKLVEELELMLDRERKLSNE